MTKEVKIRFINEAKKIINELAKKGVVVKPQDLVDIARDKYSPLHGYFIWDDTDAAEAYRCHQAGQLIGRVRVTYEKRRVRAFQKVRITMDNNKQKEGYVTTARVLSDKDLRLQVVKEGLSELRRWLSKYSVYPELLCLVKTEQVEGFRILLKAEK